MTFKRAKGNLMMLIVKSVWQTFSVQFLYPEGGRYAKIKH